MQKIILTVSNVGKELWSYFAELKIGLVPGAGLAHVHLEDCKQVRPTYPVGWPCGGLLPKVDKAKFKPVFVSLSNGICRNFLSLHLGAF